MIKKFTLLAIVFFFCSGLGTLDRLKVIAEKNQSLSCSVIQTPTENEASAGSTHIGQFAGSKYRATKFTYTGTNGKSICQVNLWLYFTGSSTHNYYVAIWGNDTVPDPDAPDDGTVLGTSDVKDLSGIGASEVEVSFDFSTPTSNLTNASIYWVVLYTATADGSNYVNWHYESNGATEVTALAEDGATWTVTDPQTYTFKFKLLSQ